MMDRPRISDEWVMGATMGAYVVLTFVLHFWGSAFIIGAEILRILPPHVTEDSLAFWSFLFRE